VLYVVLRKVLGPKTGVQPQPTGADA
jgi:hypothetical protein